MLVQEMHSRGINARYLGLVRAHIGVLSTNNEDSTDGRCG